MVSIMRRIDTMESQTIGYQPMMACHQGETETPMPTSGIVGEIDLSCFDEEGKFGAGAIEHFPEGETLPNIKPSMGPLPGLAFSEKTPTPRMPLLNPTPLDVYPGEGAIPWYGPGVYNTMATPLLDPRALKNVQVGDIVPTGDGDGVKAQDWVLSLCKVGPRHGGRARQRKGYQRIWEQCRKMFRT